MFVNRNFLNVFLIAFIYDSLFSEGLGICLFVSEFTERMICVIKFSVSTKYFTIFKVGLPPSKKIFVICFKEGPFKMMKNVFYFILKVFFVLKIFELLSWLFGHVEKTAWLER